MTMPPTELGIGCLSEILELNKILPCSTGLKKKKHHNSPNIKVKRDFITLGFLITS